MANARDDCLISYHRVLPISKKFNNDFVRRSKLTRGKGKSATKSLVTKEQVQSMIKSSMKQVTSKYLETAVYAGIAPSSTGSLVQPALPAQGIGNGQREGDSISIEGIEFRALMYNPDTNVTYASENIRLVCLQSRAGTILTTNYSTTPSTGIFDLGSGGSLDLTSFVNYNAQNETFHVLYDQCHCVTPLSSTATRLISGTIQPKVKKVNFTPGTTVALDGPIFWVAFSISATDALLFLEQRLVYHDL